MVSLEEYLRQRERPIGKIATRQTWRNLTFLHYAIDPEIIQAQLPPGLTVDTFTDLSGQEQAWIGIVPFEMRDVRPSWSPAMPWISYFPEFNLRTYVHVNGKDPGVWFFSLDAARYLACKIARTTFALPYFHARMRVHRFESKMSYVSKRMGQLGTFAGQFEISESLPLPEPGSLEFFLLERYRLYAFRRGRLFSGLVHHEPYQVTHISEGQLFTDLPKAAGLPFGKIVHRCFSPGVQVAVYPLRPYERRA